MPALFICIFQSLVIYTKREKREGKETERREYGIQRLDAIIRMWGLDNHAIVLTGGEDEQLTHKQVQRARSGRKLTLKMMQKVTRVLNVAAAKKVPSEQAGEFRPYLHRELFSYAKGYDEAWEDPNRKLYPATEK